MSRQSSRKVKLTSKFEEFSSTRHCSIQRLVQPENNTSIEVASPTKPEKVAKLEKDTVKQEQPQIQTPKINNHQQQNHNNQQQQQHQQQQQQQQQNNHETPNVAIRERSTPKPLRLKVNPATPITPAPNYQTPSGTPTPYCQVTPLPKLTANGKVRGRPRKHMMQKAETVVKPISSSREELLRLREENASLRAQLEQKTSEFEELKRQSSYTGQTVPKVDYDDLKEKYTRDLSFAKRKEWCYLCLNPSRYYCCWNTTYCSQKCQVTDWYGRHQKSCQRNKLKTAV